MSRVGAALVLCAFALAARTSPGADAAAPGVQVRVRLDREAVYLHEQVLFSVEIVHPPDLRASWDPPPFDGFWAERLATRALPDDPSGLHRTEFRRALFPTRAGDVEIAPSKLELSGDGDGGDERDVAVPGARMRVKPLPAGVAPDALVGHIELHLSGGEDRVRLGKSVPLAIELYGDANVWDAAAPDLEPLLGPDVEVFPDPPRLSIGENAGRATTRRTFHYLLVPAHAGQVRMAAIEVPYFDPASGKLETARSDPLAFEVLAGRGAEEGHASARAAPRAAERSAPRWPFLVAAAGILAAGAAVWRRARRSALARAAAPSAPSPRAAFEAASAARGSSEFAALLARAVRAGVQTRHHFDALALTSAEIRARGADREGVELLEALDRARFARRSADEEALLDRARAYLGL